MIVELLFSLKYINYQLRVSKGSSLGKFEYNKRKNNLHSEVMKSEISSDSVYIVPCRLILEN